MLDATDLVNMIKTAATEAVQAAQPAGMVFGKVIGINPLRILVEQKMILGPAQLVLTRNVTDHIIKISVAEGSGRTEEMTVHNALKQGEEVMLLRQQGGQKYIVTDRIGGGV